MNLYLVSRTNSQGGASDRYVVAVDATDAGVADPTDRAFRVECISNVAGALIITDKAKKAMK